MINPPLSRLEGLRPEPQAQNRMLPAGRDKAFEKLAIFGRGANALFRVPREGSQKGFRGGYTGSIRVLWGLRDA